MNNLIKEFNSSNGASTFGDIPPPKNLMRKIATAIVVMMVAFAGVMSQEAKAQIPLPPVPIPGQFDYVISNVADLETLNDWVMGIGQPFGPNNCAGFTLIVQVLPS